MSRTYESIPFAHQVLEALRGRKTVTADELVPLFPGKGKREVVKALQNAELRGFVKLDRSAGRSRSDAGYYAPGVWNVLEREETKRPAFPRVSCVWDLGSEPVQIPQSTGRKVCPLGGWQ